MKNLNIYLLLLFIFFALSNSLSAYNKPYIINYSKNEYKADNKNWSIGQDEKGIMYFGNDIGLLEFDGIGWSLNEMKNKLTVRSLSVLSHNTIFTGGYEEFGRWDRGISGKLEYTSLSSELDKSLFKNDDFWKIWSSDKEVYFQSFNSVFIYDYKKVERISLIKPILFLTKVRNEYWVQEIGGALFRLEGKALKKIEGSDVFSSTEVRVVLPYSTQGYLIGTATRGIYIYDGYSFKEWNSNLSNILSSSDLNCGVFTSRGTYVFGTILNGIYEIDVNGNILNQLSTENMLQNNTVLSIFQDNSDNIWAGLDRGISYIQYLSKISTHIDPRGDVGSFYAAAFWSDKLFLGTNQGVFYIDKNDLKKSSTFSNMKLIEGTQGQVWSLAVVDDRLFCAHNRGFKEIDKDLSVSEPYNVGTGVYSLKEVRLKGRDLLLLSTYNSIQLIDIKTGKSYGYNQIKEPIISGEVDHLENVWLEHFNKGVYRCRLTSDLQNIESTKYFGGDTGDGLPYKLKIFKAGGGIVLLGDNKFYRYDDISDKIVPNDLLNDCFANIKYIRNIVHIDGNLFWALTDFSIYKFKYDGYNSSIIESYDIGARNLSLINTYENISILNDSLNLVCLDNGFLLYNDRIKDRSTVKLQDIPFIESFQIKGVDGNVEFENLLEKCEIPFNSNSVTIQFSAKNTLAENYYFQYILSGVDKDWSNPQKVNSVSYDRLPKGKYVFKVRTVDNLGNYSESIIYEFEVLAPWYKTIWAYLVYILCVILLFVIVWITLLRRYRNIHLIKVRTREAKRLRLKNKELEQVVEEKNAELLTQTSSVVQRNELIIKIKKELEDYYKKQNNKKNFEPLFNKVETLLNEDINTEEDWKMFLINFEQKHTNFFKKLKDIYPQLTPNDLKLCACLRLNLDSKDIASLMNISVRAVENSRSRLRKKLNIQPHQHLNEFFLQF